MFVRVEEKPQVVILLHMYKSNNYSDGQLYNSQKEGFIYLCQDGKGNTLRDKTELVVLN